MPRADFTPAAAVSIKGRFNPAFLRFDRDKLMHDLSPVRGASGPQFYPMMARQRGNLLDMAYEEARDFLRHRDPTLLPPILELQANAGRMIGYDPDIMIASGSEIITPKGESFRPDTSLNVSAHAMQLWQVSRLVPGVKYEAAMEVEDLSFMPQAEFLRMILRNQRGPEQPPAYEIVALMPTAKVADAISVADEFASTIKPEAHKQLIEPYAARMGDTAFRLLTEGMVAAMKAQHGPSKKFAHRGANVPYMPIVPLMPNLSLRQVKHPATLYKAMGVSLRVS